MRIAIALIGLALACGAPAERPSARAPADPRLRVLWDRALEGESARAEALAGLLRALEIHRGTLRARDDQGTLGDDHRDGRIEGPVLAYRVPDEDPALAIVGADAHFRLWAGRGEGEAARASLILPHHAAGGAIGECAGCVQWGERSIVIGGTFRGRYGDDSPLAIEVEGTLERVALSEIPDDELETLLARALAQRPLAGARIEGHVLSLEVDAEALEDPEIGQGERCALALGYHSRIEIDLHALAPRSARILSLHRPIVRCCPGEHRGACSPGPRCRERELD